MKINKENYEIYVLDYIEGNLSSDIRKDFICFLEKNPDIKDQINNLKEIELEASPLSFTSKELLKKNPLNDIEGITTIEKLSIANLENDITLFETQQLDELLNNSVHKRYEFELFQKIRLIPDNTLKFPNKNRLKHKIVFGTKKIYFITSLAASIILLIGFGILYPSENYFSKGKALTDNHFVKDSNRNAQQIQTVPIIDNSKIFIVKNEILSDSVERENSDIAQISANKILAIENSYNSEIKENIDNIAIFKTTPFVLNNDYLTFGEFINKKFKENILKQPVDEKTSLASIGKAFTRVLSKITRKEIRVDKKVLEDGSKIYAFKAGSLEIYSNVKPGKKN